MKKMVAELVKNGEVIGVVRGCLKCVGTGLKKTQVMMGCILGLRVSPKHRRMGIGSELVKSIENWAIRNGAQYVYLATEENNAASINLFVHRFTYTKLSSLAILLEPLGAVRSHIRPSRDIRIDKLSVDQAISLYKDRLGDDELFPGDIHAVLREQLSLGTWVSHYREEQWAGLQRLESGGEFLKEAPSSWAVLSMWKTYQSYKLQIRGGPVVVRCFHATLSHIGSRVLPCLRAPQFAELFSGPFGFLFLFGLHGEGERTGELMRSLWCFASGVAATLNGCKAVVTELGAGDPLMEHLRSRSSVSRIDDLWFLKRVDGGTNGDDESVLPGPMSRVFVDPRDF